MIGCVQSECLQVNANDKEKTVTLYFIDNTQEQWIKNDNAVIELVDNTNGHICYDMTKQDESTWTAQVPESATNITFNRYDFGKLTQWNSWSAGGREGNNAYYADGSEYGHWDNVIENDEGNYFHAGDIIYLDLSEFTSWENDNADMYTNFSDATKKQNDGNDVDVSSWENSGIYYPKVSDYEISEHVYAYILTEQDQGKNILRFWRGNDTTLWNYTITLDYEQYKRGYNCIKVTGWNAQGKVVISEYDMDYLVDVDENGIPDYTEAMCGNDKLKTDTDGDDVPNYVEQYFGSNCNSKDTDNDGLSDYYELYVFGSDPAMKDTDNDGILDADEDLDADELSDLEEINYKSNPFKEDSDEDGLLDGDEVYKYFTDLLNKDTDGDKVSDGKEVSINTNPLVAEASFDVIENADAEDSVKVSVEISLSGEQVESLNVYKVDNDFLFPETMPGYIGGAYDFSVDGTFTSATLVFEFDECLLKNESFDPVIYYYNEDTQLLEALETTVKGNVAMATVSHFSKYILINRSVYEDSFEWQDVWNTSGFTNVEVVLIVDDSSSMEWNDPLNERLIVAQNLIDKLPDNSKIGVVKFSSSTSKLTETITDDKEKGKEYLTESYFGSWGNTYMYNAINSSFSMFESTDVSTLKMIVVLSDGATSDTSLHSSVVSTANSKGVRIYTVGLGNSTRYFNSYLKPLANNTGAAFYYASDASQLEDIYNDINKKIDIETDSDNDGIADYYEDNMVMFNGVTITLDKNNPDSDNDGLSDGEEVVELNYEYNFDKTQVIVRGKILSNPLKADSDDDGI